MEQKGSKAMPGEEGESLFEVRDHKHSGRQLVTVG